VTAVNPDTSRQAVVEAALVLLKRMGLTRRTWPPSPSVARRCRPSPSTSRSCRRRSARGPAGRTARTGTGSSSSGAAAVWMSPPRRRSGS